MPLGYEMRVGVCYTEHIAGSYGRGHVLGCWRNARTTYALILPYFVIRN